MTAANDQAIRRALEAAGIELIAEDGGGIGVRLRAPRNQRKLEDSLPDQKQPPSRGSTFSIASPGRTLGTPNDRPGIRLRR